ncbi:MAG: CHAD domain-containing protein [Solirubrobacterales bacterium]
MKARKVSGLDPAQSLRANAERIIATRLDELTGLAEEALEPSAAAAQHDLRIAAKRLRYVLEITAGCLGPEAEALRETAKQLQEVLGEIHDCDVMLPRVANVESVEALLRTRRELLFARFRELWRAEEPLAAP